MHQIYNMKKRREASLDEARTSGLGHSMSGLHHTAQACGSNYSVRQSELGMFRSFGEVCG